MRSRSAPRLMQPSCSHCPLCGALRASQSGLAFHLTTSFTNLISYSSTWRCEIFFLKYSASMTYITKNHVDSHVWLFSQSKASLQPQRYSANEIHTEGPRRHERDISSSPHIAGRCSSYPVCAHLSFSSVSTSSSAAAWTKNHFIKLTFFWSLIHFLKSNGNYINNMKFSSISLLIWPKEMALCYLVSNN